MIIHSPIISGSLTFAEGGTFTLPDNGVYSGSFSGSINGIGDPETFSASVDTRIDQLVIDTGSQDSRLTSLEGFTSSIDTTIKTKLDADSVISGSSQVNADTITNFDSNVKTKLDADSVISGSSQVSFTDISNKPTLVSGSSQIDITSTTGTLDISSRTNLAVSDTSTVDMVLTGDTLSANAIGGIISGSSQVTYSGISSIPAGIVSGSSQVTPLLPSGTVSGSSQVSFNSIVDKPTLVSGSAQIDITLTTGTLDISSRTNLAVSDTTNVDMILTGDTLSANLKGGVVSGSSQIDLTQTTNYSSGIKTRLDAEGVTSGSTHILALVSIDEDTMSSNSDTKLPTQQSVKTYVDTEISALVSGSPATLDTLNELAAALGDDPNFATTISTTIGGKVSQSLQIISGNGLTGGGNLTTDRTLAVGGTADRISVSADAVDIASTYIGQSTITTLGTITTGTWAATDVAVAHGGTGASTQADARTNLGLVIGTDVQAYNSTLAAVAGGTYSGDDSITTVGTISTGTWNGSVIASAYLDADTAHLSGTQTFTGAKTFSDSTASTTKTTGAVIVTGGVGIGGALNVGGDVVAYASSDRRLKDNIQNIENPIEKVQKLNGVTWDWNSNADELQQSLPNVGVIAQEVEEVFPQLVHDRDNGYKGVDYAKLTGLLIEAIKEQQKQIDDLKSRL